MEKLTYLHSNRDKWSFIFFIGLYSFVFLTFFQPFGINNHDPNFSISFQFVLATISVAFVIVLSLILSEFLFRKGLMIKWTIVHLIIWYTLVSLFCATTTFIFYNYLGNWHDWRWESYFDFLVDVPIMMLIPIIVIILFFKYREAKKKLLIEESRNPAKLIELFSDNGKNQISLALSNMLYLESQENYVAVHFVENESPKKILLRTTMNSLEKLLIDTPVKRCHRSFMINLTKVIKHHKYSGNESVVIASIDREIPISEKYKLSLKKNREV